uniref:BED-type domain-containing protein n=1 Tax=Strongyloides papillosus TaxID=174720 RepID=A0A0N5B429_STREA
MSYSDESSNLLDEKNKSSNYCSNKGGISKYKECYSKYDGINKSKNGELYFNCSYCGKDLKLSKMGEKAIKKHIACTSHLENKKSVNQTVCLSTLLRNSNQSNDSESLAELCYSFHIVFQGLSFKISDCSSELFKKIFSDSEIAKNYKMKRTKAAAVINKVLPEIFSNKILEELKELNIPFSLSIDSTSISNLKIFLILIRY